MASEGEDIEGPGYAVVRPHPAPLGVPMEPFERVVEPVSGFLRRIETVCVVACCDLEAYDTSDAAVRIAAGDEDRADLARRLRRAAGRADASTTDRLHVDGGGIVIAAEAGRWLDELAATVERVVGDDPGPGQLLA